MTHSYVWHDAFICVTWLIHMFDMIQSYVWHDSFICAFSCVTWHIHMRSMTHSCAWQNSLQQTCGRHEWCRTHEPWVMSHTSKHSLSRTRVRHVTRASSSWYTYECVMVHCLCPALNHSVINAKKRSKSIINPLQKERCFVYMLTTSLTCNRRNTLQHTATHCKTLQNTAKHCYTLQHP